MRASADAVKSVSPESKFRTIQCCICCSPASDIDFLTLYKFDGAAIRGVFAGFECLGHVVKDDLPAAFFRTP
jgi:hypothetical protein